MGLICTVLGSCCKWRCQRVEPLSDPHLQPGQDLEPQRYRSHMPCKFSFVKKFFFLPQRLILETPIATLCPASVLSQISTESAASLDQFGLGMLGKQESL